MATLDFNSEVKLAGATLQAIESAVLRGNTEGPRPHLGASLIGRSCERQLFYTFRWAKTVQHPPRLLRLFARGQREEDTMVGLLRSAGITVHQVDQQTGRQFSFGSGHFGGSMDGACVGVPEAPKTWHCLEFKTHNAKSFKELQAKGVKQAKPEHWSQVQCYMAWTGMERALYMAVCKDDDQLHIERVDFDKEAADKLFAKADRIINATEPPPRIGGADWFECKWCDYRDMCHDTDVPEPNCRTCAHSTPEPSGKWSCSRHQQPEIPLTFQRKGCDAHRFIPALLHWANPVQANHDDNWITYQVLPDGGNFTNGAPPEGLSSAEIHACKDKAALAVVCNEMQNLRQQFGATLVG